MTRIPKPTGPANSGVADVTAPAQPAGSPATDTGAFGLGGPQPQVVVSQADMAAYLADMLLDMREVATTNGFETLSRVLEIAEREARWRMGPRP